MRSIHLCFSLALILQWNIVQSQTRPGYKWWILPSPEKNVKQIPVAVPDSAAIYPMLPSVDLSPDMPPAGYQGKPLSCGAFAIAYGIKTFYEKRKHKYSYLLADSTPDPTKLFSPAFLHNMTKAVQRKPKCQSPTDFLTLLEIYRTRGMASLRDFPYDTIGLQPCRNPFDDPQLMERAQLHRMAFPERVESLDQMRFFLANNMPILTELIVDYSFDEQGQAASAFKTRFQWHPTPGLSAASDSLELHAMACIGYDPNGFEFLNSWGTHWGNQGKVYISNEDVNRLKGVMYVIYDLPVAQSAMQTRQETAQADGHSLHLIGGQSGKLHGLGFTLKFIGLSGNSIWVEVKTSDGQYVNDMYISIGKSKQFSYLEQDYRVRFGHIGKASDLQDSRVQLLVEILPSDQYIEATSFILFRQLEAYENLNFRFTD